MVSILPTTACCTLTWACHNISDVISFQSLVDHLLEIPNKVSVIIKVFIFSIVSVPGADHDMLLGVPVAHHLVTHGIVHVLAPRACPKIPSELSITWKIHLDSGGHLCLQFELKSCLRNVQIFKTHSTKC